MHIVRFQKAYAQHQITYFPSNLHHASKHYSIIRPLDQVFKKYVDSDGIFVPEGSENLPAESSLSDQEEKDDDKDDDAVGRYFKFSFPDLDERIRQVIEKYGAVFPKLNFSCTKGQPIAYTSLFTSRQSCLSRNSCRFIFTSQSTNSAPRSIPT
ncbi:hypothetical protein DFJ58DRAFT_917253 [Suillus subalutaceus]|uniref:uncharacterized protein n=1 Tax=Suillus subalutaceus TaxID=48586 RepID=UPI001B878EA3|nr:uncharacterized protein DFJ58DRAFT_917253 [Suillus subalutaceus]KAG1838019.1 hypothetical protein DFJ58DRAFT_917253 [Suillus subalutaceus]